MLLLLRRLGAAAAAITTTTTATTPTATTTATTAATATATVVTVTAVAVATILRTADDSFVAFDACSRSRGRYPFFRQRLARLEALMCACSVCC